MHTSRGPAPEPLRSSGLFPQRSYFSACQSPTVSIQTEASRVPGRKRDTCSKISHFKIKSVNRYIFVAEKKPWLEALTYCRKHHTDLISIRNESVNDEIRGIIQEFWIGLYGNFYNFRWSMVQEGLDDEGQLEYSNWQPTQPNADDDNIVCVNMAPFGQWADYVCSAPLSFVCYDGKRTHNHKTSLSVNNISLLHLFIAVQRYHFSIFHNRHPENSSENRYIFVPEEKPWLEALTYCRKHHTDLVSIRNESVNDEVRSIVQSNSWIGLYRLSWMWSDGQSRHIHSFNNWDEPNRVIDHCATTNHSRWTERPCSHKYSFICSGE
uniref:C-type lectin domain-containing protein n=1 Tax=Salarias fasciatus TaxID=181472 RepID=A0A672GTQ8_SALFA